MNDLSGGPKNSKDKVVLTEAEKVAKFKFDTQVIASIADILDYFVASGSGTSEQGMVLMRVYTYSLEDALSGIGKYYAKVADGESHRAEAENIFAEMVNRKDLEGSSENSNEVELVSEFRRNMNLFNDIVNTLDRIVKYEGRSIAESIAALHMAVEYVDNSFKQFSAA